MKRLIAGMATGTALLAGVVSAAPAHAAQASFCMLTAGSGSSCYSSFDALDMAAHHNEIAVVTLYAGTGYTGDRVAYFANAACSAESDFSPADYVATLPSFMAQNAESVDKHDAGHCNWMLVGPSGGTSTEVEGDWSNLANLGSGWDNRAVKIKLD